MTQDDIIRMALEAGFVAYGEDAGEYRIPTRAFHCRLERFAALVAAAERNKLAAWMMERGYSTGHGDTIEDMLKELDWQIRESERKTCATDAEWCIQNHLEHLIPERIRARGESK